MSEQKKDMQVSLYDHTSKLGRQLTKARRTKNQAKRDRQKARRKK